MCIYLSGNNKLTYKKVYAWIQVDISQSVFVFVRKTFFKVEECRKVLTENKGATINDNKKLSTSWDSQTFL